MTADSESNVDVVMPRLGESIVEGTVVRWAVAVGQTVQRGDLLADVETDKATADIPSPAAGIVDALLVAEGDTVPVGQVILRLRSERSSAAPKPSAVASTASLSPPPAPDPKTAAARLPNTRLIDQPSGEPGGPRRTSPAVRRLARTHRIDLHALTGSGHRGRVTRDDVLQAVQGRADGRQDLPAPSPTPAPSPAPAPIFAEPVGADYRPPVYRPGPRDRVEPLSRRRRQIASHMRYSLETSAHVATVAEVDMHAVERARAIDGPRCAADGLKLTMLAYVVQAVAQTLIEVPLMNATVQGDQLIIRGDRNVGIAVDTPQGVIVPVIRNADELGLTGIARAIETLSARARAGQAQADDLAGGSFTISNPGREGNLFGISIIRQPEVGILRMGTIVKRPVVRTVDDQDAIVIRPMMHAALSYDHRLIDGRTGNGFLYRLAQRLQAVQPR